MYLRVFNFEHFLDLKKMFNILNDGFRLVPKLVSLGKDLP
jgi:hypothetical protein